MVAKKRISSNLGKMTSSKIAIAGASGFVGTCLRMALAEKYRWIALTRSESRAAQAEDCDNTEWRQCDLFSLPQVSESLRGVERAIYMVHSMLPSSRLTQGSFEDFDLLLADNFIRGAEEAGVRRIIYLGGLVPELSAARQMSPHLASRLEVEKVLSSRSIPVTVLRAGVIFGPGGSSAQMLINLARRLPFMVLPAWTSNQTQSVDVRDIIRAVDLCLQDERFSGGQFDIGGHPPMPYREMILGTAKVLQRHPITIPVPFNFIRLSRLWVSLFSGIPANLVNPLLESLQHDIKAKANPLSEMLQAESIPFRESILAAVDDKGHPLPNPRQKTQKKDSRMIHRARRVRSVQRMPLPSGWTARDLVHAYVNWLTRWSFGLIRGNFDSQGTLFLYLVSPRLVLLRFTPTPYSRNSDRRRAYYIGSGILSKPSDPPGRFELRLFPEMNCLIAAVHGYVPSLPWYLYAYTQAPVHLLVMKGFSFFLAAQKRRQEGE